MGELRDVRWADRIRAAACVALVDARRPLTIAELVERIELQGLLIPSDRPGKTLSDLLRCEVDRGHVRRVSRGNYAAFDIPRSTLTYMRIRVAKYIQDPTKPYKRPSYNIGTRVSEQHATEPWGWDNC